MSCFLVLSGLTLKLHEHGGLAQDVSIVRHHRHGTAYLVLPIQSNPWQIFNDIDSEIVQKRLGTYAG